MRNRLPVGPHGQGSDGTHIFERDLQTQDHLKPPQPADNYHTKSQ